MSRQGQIYAYATVPFDPAPVPVPPDFADLLGYGGDARLVAFWWDAGADEVGCFDGTILTVGQCAWVVWSAWAQHPAVGVRLAQAGIDLGAPEEERRHALLLDRIDGSAWIGPYAGVLAWLGELTPRPPAAGDEVAAAVEALQRALGPRRAADVLDEAEQALCREQAAAGRVCAYLDAAPHRTDA